MSHQTHYRSYRGRFLLVIYDQTNSVKALKETTMAAVVAAQT